MKIGLLSALNVIFMVVRASSPSEPLPDIDCQQLKCATRNPGQLVQYGIFETEKWTKIPAFVCSRHEIVCEYYEGFLASRSKECTTTPIQPTHLACLKMGLTKQSVDGTL